MEYYIILLQLKWKSILEWLGRIFIGLVLTFIIGCVLLIVFFGLSELADKLN